MVGVPVSRPVAVLSVAQAGLYWMLKLIVSAAVAVAVGWKTYGVPAVTVAAAVPLMVTVAAAGAPPLAASALQPVRLAASAEEKQTATQILTAYRHTSLLMCHLTAGRRSKHYGVTERWRSGSTAPKIRIGLLSGAGNPAISNPIGILRPEALRPRLTAGMPWLCSRKQYTRMQSTTQAVARREQLHPERITCVGEVV